MKYREEGFNEGGGWTKGSIGTISRYVKMIAAPRHKYMENADIDHALTFSKFNSACSNYNLGEAMLLATEVLDEHN